MGYAATFGTSQALRLATVTRGNVIQTIDTSGTITSSAKYTPSFASTGTVRNVDVQVGEAVRKGQTLATLETTSLQAALDSAKASLAQARQQLEADETGQSSSNNSSPTAQTIAFVRPLHASTPTAPSTDELVAQVKAAQQVVVGAQQALDAGQAAIDSAQRTVDTDVSSNTQLRDAQVAACGTPSADCTSAMVAYQTSADALAADVTTLDAAIATQDANTKTLDSAITALDALVGKLRSTSDDSSSGSHDGSGSTPSGGSGSTPSGARKNPTGSNGSSGSNGSASADGSADQPASAAQIAADQAAIDAARAQVKVAAQDLAAATLTSPIDGQVAAIGLTTGASSSGKTITIVGTGGQGVSVTVALPQIDQVKLGQRVTIAADGSARALHGTVASIGLVSSAAGSTTTFPVTIRLDARSPRLYDGTGADIEITTGRAAGVLLVPNSAVHPGPRNTHTVTIMRHGKPTSVPVTVGLAGSDRTEIKTGLKAGEQVELADPSQDLPASTSSNDGLRGLGGLRPFAIGGG